MKILVFIAGFLTAVLVRSFVDITPLVAVFVLVIGISIILGEKMSNRVISKEIFYLALVIFSFGIGVLRYDIKDFHILQLENHVEEKAEFTGVVVSEPEKRESDVRAVVRAEGEKILLSTNIYTDLKYGDEIKFSGKLRKPGVIDEESGRQFDYAKYLSRDDIYYTMSFAKVEVISSGHGQVVTRTLLKIKESFVSKMKEILSEPQSSLLAGLVISGKNALPENVLEEFRRAGVVHLVVLSGYNITVVANFFFTIFGSVFLLLKSRRSWIPRVASILGIVLFVLMAGASPSVVRAALMAFVVVGGKIFRREYDVTRALILAAFAMIVWNPKTLVFDPSFQLSFLATIGLIYITPIVEKYLSRIPNKLGLREITSITLATQITVLPFIIYSMGNFSLVSLLSNILILPLVPITMLIGFVAVMFAFITPIVAMPFTYISHLLLSWILGVSHTLGNMEYSLIEVKQFSVWVVIGVYALLLGAYLRLQRGKLLLGSQTSLYTSHQDL